MARKKKVEETQENIDLEKEAVKMPSGMKETAERMMSGQFDMNDMLAQLKQIKKMSNFSGLLKMVPGMSGAVAAMKEKIKDKALKNYIKDSLTLKKAPTLAYNNQIYNRRYSYSANTTIVKNSIDTLRKDFDFSKYSRFKFDEPVLGDSSGQDDTDDDLPI